MDRQEQRRPYWREEDEHQEMEEFQDRHRSFADKVERLLIQLVVLGLVALVLVQALQLNRLTLLTAMEGVPVNEVADWSRSLQEEQTRVVSGISAPMRVKVMSVTRRSVPGAKLLVDGKSVGDFGQGWVAIDLRPGQVLVVDGGAYPESLTFRVVEVTGLAAPTLGASVTTRGDRQRLGVAQPAGHR